MHHEEELKLPYQNSENQTLDTWTVLVRKAKLDMVANLKYTQGVLNNIQKDPSFEDYVFVPPNLDAGKK